jgi:hypothetical protein
MNPNWFAVSTIKPDPKRGGYAGQGEAILEPAHVLIDRAYPPSRARPARDGALRECVSRFARARQQGLDAVMPQSTAFEHCMPTVQAVCSHALWTRFDVLAAPLHMADKRRQLATTADLLVRFASDQTIGLGILQTAPPDLLRHQAVLAELGAALAMAIDNHQQAISRVFTIWAVDGQARVDSWPIDEALAAWVDAAQLDSWLKQVRRA